MLYRHSTLLTSWLLTVACAEDRPTPAGDTTADTDSETADPASGNGSTGPVTTTGETGGDETTGAQSCETPPSLSEGNALAMVTQDRVAVGSSTVLVYDRHGAVLVPLDGGCPMQVPELLGDLSVQELFVGHWGDRFVVASNPGGLENGTVRTLDEATGEVETLLDDRIVFSMATAPDHAYVQTRNSEVLRLRPDGEVTLVVAHGTQSIDALTPYSRVRVIGDRVAMRGDNRVLSWPGTPSGDGPFMVYDGTIEIDTFLTPLSRVIITLDRVAFTTSTGAVYLTDRGASVFGADSDPIEPIAMVGTITFVAVRGDAVYYVPESPDGAPVRLAEVSSEAASSDVSSLSVDGNAVIAGDEVYFVSDGVLVALDLPS